MSPSDQFAFAASPSPEDLAAFELNDYGNAMRLILHAGGLVLADGEVDVSAATLLYVRDTGWAGWNGRHWDLRMGPRLAERLAHHVGQSLAGPQSKALVDRGVPSKEVATFVRSAGNASAISAMLRVAEPYLQVNLDDFDPDPLALTVRNGTLRFERQAGEGLKVAFAPHDPRDRITRMASVDYDPEAAAPIWEQTLAAWHPDEAMRGYLKRLAGYAFTGCTHEQVIVIHQGRGRDGKSTFMNALRELAGDYGEVADVRTFLDSGPRGGGDATPDLARLAGDCRFLSVAEPPRGAKLNEAMIKSFTGGAPIVARRLRQDLFSFTPRPKVFMEANSRPVIKGDDEGIWRRIRLIMWEHQLAPDQVDTALPGKLRREASGIFNWIISGVGDWLSFGLDEPPRVAEAMDDYRKGSSPFGEWFAERIELDPNARVPASALFADYKAWCEDQGTERIMSQTGFGAALADRQIIRCGRGTGGVIMRQGARLRSRWDEASAGSGFASEQ
ncbi:MAG: hypothetical protein IM653_07805 [Phenylobacterium sp.]|uniref:DNA primase family protein n=2 Tax=Phenylobacterium sp. TaxID=1871053 RepID=UPI0025F65F59|nr:DNA primase family protein [Phenylobacterium sp.]MCA6227330.1 hypothetical protein [Phenylobacterium sp.]MCA6230824.1 hypothetical protein [Phenylobacterium sp.]MCA6235026.1 hypothetical protein [Phenylobacterium sp.]MCA6249409.1 hypothetical protein [Phenylobacterium sp.]MCA6250904.1 hypothetical protein [Phenylobacterium sp.]